MSLKYSDGYYSAHICEHGHVASSYGAPDGNYCKECGAEIVHHCQNCFSPMKGRPTVVVGGKYKIPNYCTHCGQAFPWTLETKEALNELLKLSSEISSEDAAYIDDNFESLIVDTPRTKLLATKLSIMLSKATPVIADATRGLLVDVLSETAKKIMFPGL